MLNAKTLKLDKQGRYIGVAAGLWVREDAIVIVASDPDALKRVIPRLHLRLSDEMSGIKNVLISRRKTR